MLIKCNDCSSGARSAVLVTQIAFLSIFHRANSVCITDVFFFFNSMSLTKHSNIHKLVPADGRTVNSPALSRIEN